MPLRSSLRPSTLQTERHVLQRERQMRTSSSFSRSASLSATLSASPQATSSSPSWRSNRSHTLEVGGATATAGTTSSRGWSSPRTSSSIEGQEEDDLAKALSAMRPPSAAERLAAARQKKFEAELAMEKARDKLHGAVDPELAQKLAAAQQIKAEAQKQKTAAEEHMLRAVQVVQAREMVQQEAAARCEELTSKISLGKAQLIAYKEELEEAEHAAGIVRRDETSLVDVSVDVWLSSLFLPVSGKPKKFSDVQASLFKAMKDATNAWDEKAGFEFPDATSFVLAASKELPDVDVETDPPIERAVKKLMAVSIQDAAARLHESSDDLGVGMGDHANGTASRLCSPFTFVEHSHLAGGLEGHVGLPRALDEAQWLSDIENEHCGVDSFKPESEEWGASDRRWRTAEHNLWTSPKLEHAWVTSCQFELQAEHDIPGAFEKVTGDDVGSEAETFQIAPKQEYREIVAMRRVAVPLQELYGSAAQLMYNTLTQISNSDCGLHFSMSQETFEEKFAKQQLKLVEILAVRLYSGTTYAIYQQLATRTVV